MSGTPPRQLVNRSLVEHDVTSTNRTFFERLDSCNTEKDCGTSFALEELLAGSGLTADEVLEDGELHVVVADDTEIRNAELTVCWEEESSESPAGDSCRSVKNRW